MSTKKTVVEKVRSCGSCSKPSVTFVEKVTINLGDYQSLSIEAGYSNIGSEEELAAMQELFPKVIEAADGDMGKLIQDSLGNGVREDMKAAVLAAVAQLPAPKEKK